jgi:hypothetical protein
VSTETDTTETVTKWRRHQLRESGFPLPVAAQITDDGRYDLHALIELVERGCPPALAIRILAPLDDKPIPTEST